MDAATTCKVDEVVDRYDLERADPRYESLNEGLLHRWRGSDGRDAVGYRPLTEWFHKRLLRRVYDEHGRETLGERIEHEYRALTGDDEILREEVVESLAADDIDAAAIREDLVSWGTMRTHLQECLEGTKPSEPSSGDWERETVAMARSFATEKVEQAVSSLSSKNDLAGREDVSVAVEVQLACAHCPTRVPFEVALDRGYVCEDHAAGIGSET
jgi:hypothetical protein